MTTNNQQLKKGIENERIVFIDYLRIVACFLVMLVHSSENFYGADSSGLAGNISMLANETNRFWVSFYDGGVARTCVPLFMVVSAFLLVPMKPGTSMKGFYQHRFKRILPPMIVFLLLYSYNISRRTLLYGRGSIVAWFRRHPLSFLLSGRPYDLVCCYYSDGCGKWLLL